MTQVEDQAGQAEERSEETRSFVRQVRAVTRRKYTPEEKIRTYMLECLEAERRYRNNSAVKANGINRLRLLRVISMVTCGLSGRDFQWAVSLTRSQKAEISRQYLRRLL